MDVARDLIFLSYKRLWFSNPNLEMQQLPGARQVQGARLLCYITVLVILGCLSPSPSASELLGTQPWSFWCPQCISPCKEQMLSDRNWSKPQETVVVVHTEEARVVLFLKAKSLGRGADTRLRLIHCKERSRLQLPRVSIFTEAFLS